MVRALSDIGQLRPSLCVDEASVGIAVTPSLHGRVHLELRDFWLVVVGQWQTLLLILLVGPRFIRHLAFLPFVRPLSFANWLTDVELLLVMMSEVTSTFLIYRRMNCSHPLVAS